LSPGFPAKLKAAIRQLPCVFVCDNDDLRNPFRRVAVVENGLLAWSAKQLRRWLDDLNK
jgi:hypothetical protein